MMRKLLTPLAALGLSLALAAPLSVQSIAGPYLAARSAAIQSDFEQAASYYTRALARDPGNLFLMESALVAQLAMGRLEQALPIAQAMQRAGQISQVAQLALTADKVINGEYEALLEERDGTQLIGPLVDGLIEAWALIGTGDVREALARFDAIAAQQGLQAFAMFHKAMAVASVGDFEAADAIFSSDANGTVLQTRRGILARVEILSQLEREDEALRLLETTFSGATDPEIDSVIAALAQDEPMPFTHVNSVQEGFARGLLHRGGSPAQ